MSDQLDRHLKAKLDERAGRGLLRRLPDGKPTLIDFASNDYLGLARSQELRCRIEQELQKVEFANGSTGSRLLTGNDPYTEEAESELAGIFRSEAALIFSSGYSANLSVLSSIPQRGDTIIYDELSHASIKDGARLSLAKRLSFAHNNLEDLRRKIAVSTGHVYVVVESIYSMDGDVCPLKDLVELTSRAGAHLILDEAHSTGVWGADGSGMAVDSGLHARIPIRIYTFGKAMGIHGACVTGSGVMRDYLINFGRPFIYTTAPDRHAVASIRCAFAFLNEHPDLQPSLRRNIDVFLSGISGRLNRTQSESAIQTLIIPGSDQVRAAAREIGNNGMDVRPIVSPTVAEGKERLRICLHAYNTPDEIRGLTTLLNQYLENE